MKRLAAALSVLALALTAASAHATAVVASYQTSYTVTLDGGWPAVTNLMMLEKWPGGGSGTWAFTAAGDGQTTVLTNPFPSDTLPTSSLLIGLVQDLPNDPPGQQHVVLFMDDTAASLGANIAWGTLFRNTLEDNLAASIALATSGQDWPIIQPGLDAVSLFTDPPDGDAVTGILDGLAQPHSAWFETGGTFSVMAWSDGTLIGTGTSEITVVPEPATAALMLGGLGLFGCVARRRHDRVGGAAA